MKWHRIIGLVVLFGALAAVRAEAYPPAQGFDQAGSDPKAIEIVDAVMKNMGGWDNWNKTHYLTWKFFNGRMHVWDKWTGNLRFESNGLTILMNINTKQGKVYRNGVQITDPDSVAKYLDHGYKAWVNDSYWLLMPYKLKDSGVTLKYEGEGKMSNGRDAYILNLTFKDVGVTPNNMYDVYVDKADMMVEEWAYYKHASDDKPGFRTPWADWTRHGKVLISADRGNRKLTDVAAFDTLPDSVFTSPAPIDIMAYPKAAP